MSGKGFFKIYSKAQCEWNRLSDCLCIRIYSLLRWVLLKRFFLFLFLIFFSGGWIVSCRGKGEKLKHDAGENESFSKIPSLMQFASGKIIRENPFKIGWDERTGRGPVLQSFEDGSRIEVCFQCGFKGYTGGLSIGGFNSPGFMYVPAKPIRGFNFLNIWCAFDDTIFEIKTEKKYNFGWSQNYGERAKGERLIYTEGRIYKISKDKIVLKSVNEGGCFKVSRFVEWNSGDRFLIFTQTIENRCHEKVEFDYWIGEDPWIGTYKSSEGDVGWVMMKDESGVKSEIIRNEYGIDGKDFVCGGLYDLGNRFRGEGEGGFSNQANFIRISPFVKHPTAVYWANSFAHEESDIDSNRPLDNKTIIAMNIGWKGISLEGGGKFLLGWALGVAGEPEKTGNPPICPEIPYEKWFPVRSQNVIFDEEKVNLKVQISKKGNIEVVVTGRYLFYNPNRQNEGVKVDFPFMIDESMPFPEEFSVDGSTGKIEKKGKSIEFYINVPQGKRKEVVVRYVQKIAGCHFGYIIKTVAGWGMPLRHALFEIEVPDSIARKKISITPGAFKKEVENKTVVYRAFFENFNPEEDILVSWRCR